MQLYLQVELFYFCHQNGSTNIYTFEKRNTIIILNSVIMIKLCSTHGLLTSILLIVFSLMSNDAIAQKAIRGTVLDEANEPIIGASVLVKGTTNGSITGLMEPSM